MTTKQLIEILQKLPEDAVVLRADNDDGPTDIYGISVTKFVWVADKTKLGGGYHEECIGSSFTRHHKDKPQIKGVVLI